MVRDAVHPDAPGQVVMAAAMVSDLGLPRQLSYIRMQKKDNGEFRAFASGGQLTDLKETEGGMEFTWLADSLPWILPEDAQAGVVMTKMGHKLTREGLEIHDLKTGYYQLTIDDQVIGRYHSSVLERHLELQGNKKTPQYQQAAKVAELNSKRNSGPVRTLRGEWLKFQRHARALAAKGKSADDNPLPGMDQRVEQAIAQAKALEEEIFQNNQPKSHKYSLKFLSVLPKPAGKKKAAASGK